MRLPTQRGISAPQASEKRRSWVKFEIGMIPGTIGIVHAELARVVDEAEIRIGVVEILGDRAIGAGIDLGLEVAQVGQRVVGLRMAFRIAADFDVEEAVVFLADELDQVRGIAEIAGDGPCRRAGRRAARRCAGSPSPCSAASSSPSSARVPPTQEMCGAASRPWAWCRRSTVSGVYDSVEPPAPNVHDT